MTVHNSELEILQIMQIMQFYKENTSMTPNMHNMGIFKAKLSSKIFHVNRYIYIAFYITTKPKI